MAVSSGGITNTGKAVMAGLCVGADSQAAFTYLAYGTGTTDFAADQTALVAQSQRASATASRVTTTVTNDTSQLVKNFSVVTTETISEVAAFNAAASGSMWCRSVLSPTHDTVAGDTFAYIQQVKFA